MAEYQEEEPKDPEDLLHDVEALGRQLERLRAQPSPVRIAQLLEGSVQPILQDIAKALVDHDEALGEMSELLEMSRLRPEHADAIRQAIEGARWCLERLKTSERDPSVLEKIDEVSGALLFADRVVTKAESDYEDEAPDGDEDEDETDGEVADGAPEIPRNGEPHAPEPS